MEKPETISWPNEAARYLILLTQLGLLFIALRQFQIESSAFLRVAGVAFIGFAIHYFLPLRYRLPFFTLLSLGAIALVFGPVSAAWLVGLGMVLIGLCHLPIGFWSRVGLLIIFGTLLAVFRAEWLPSPWSAAIWPILGSMFMFRLMVYLYDLEHDKAPFSLSRTMSYFFMLPNVCFPMFPVVDYKTFRRTYYDTDRHQIYQTGIRWMTRGVVHLILYRFVYYYMTIAPAEVNTPTELVQLMVTTFLLYLRISGQFHLIVGMLYLFGFRLPETHHLYYLASSFTDVWRRINIYWKDFMMKIFYYPVYFRLRRMGNTVALVLSTVFVFVITWALHSYQWFWLRGSFLVSTLDIAFWILFALLVILNLLSEMKFGRGRSLTGANWSVTSVSIHALQTFATFVSICVLWSLWTSESFVEWTTLWTAMEGVGFLQAFVAILATVSAVIVVGLVAAVLWKKFAVKGKAQLSFSRTAISNAALLLCLAAVGVQGVYVQFGPQTATFVNTLRSGRLSRVDLANLERGYYENLTRVDRFNSQLWEVYMNRPATWMDVMGSGLEEFRDDFLQKELVPSFVVSTNFGSMRTNRWGMRDQDYEQTPSQGTYRIAVLGPSTVMGWGVADGETFEAVLEHRLNAERRNNMITSYEVLNFGVPGYEPPQQVMALEKTFQFKPDAVIYVAFVRESTRAVWYISEVVSKGIPIPYPYLNELLQRAGVPNNAPEAVATQRLMPYADEILAWTYRKIAEECRARNVVPILAFLPAVGVNEFEHEGASIMTIAKEAGFLVLNLDDAFRDHDARTLWLAEWDQHPNAKAHEVLANRLYEELENNAGQIFPVTQAMSSGK